MKDADVAATQAADAAADLVADSLVEITAAV
jgi:hypothetical protein